MSTKRLVMVVEDEGSIRNMGGTVVVRLSGDVSQGT